MADEPDEVRAIRRRIRRRAQLDVRNLGGIEELRNVLLNARADANSSSSDTSVSGALHSDNDAFEENEFHDPATDDESDELNDNDNILEGAEVIDAQEPNPLINNEDIEQYVIQSLREWGSSGGVLSMSKLDELLSKLAYVFPNMPLSYKTLLQTCGHVDVQQDGHKFWYKGLQQSLDQLDLIDYLEALGVIKVDINMDGLPLPGGIKFWPILGRLVGSAHPPFIIAIHCGTKDPRDIDLYLGDFVIEVDSLMRNGYMVNGRSYDFQIRHFILDAPARSLIKCCILHGGYGACEKCTVVGVHTQGRMNYFHLGDDCRPRTDESYANQEDRLHHTGVSPLQLLGVGMVSQFRLDSMHLVYKGVFLRFLEAMLTWEGDWNLTANQINVISTKLVAQASSCPRDFNRKPKKLEDYYKYKATQLRRMLLYDGCVAFHNVLPDDLYSCFLLLHCGMYILGSPYLLHQLQLGDFADSCLKAFIQFSADIFGEHFVTLNVHGISHLAEECRAHGVLENFSAFCFENFLKSIKETLRSGYLQLEQIIKRDSERTEKVKVTLPHEGNKFELFQPSVDPHDELEGQHYKRICVNNTTFRVKGKDACFMTRDGTVAILMNIVRREDGDVVFRGKRFTEYEDLYNYPINSSQLGIMRVKGLQNDWETFPLELVFAKCWLMPQNNDDEHISIPLAHSIALLDFLKEDEHILGFGRISWLTEAEDESLKCWCPPQEQTFEQMKQLLVKKANPGSDWVQEPCTIIKTYSNFLSANLGLKHRLANGMDYVTETELGVGLRKKKKSKKALSEEECNSPPRPVKKKPCLNVPVPSFQFLPSGAPALKPIAEARPSTSKSKKNQTNQKTANIVRKKRGTEANSMDTFKNILAEKKLKISSQKNDLKKIVNENQEKEANVQELKKLQAKKLELVMPEISASSQSTSCEETPTVPVTLSLGEPMSQTPPSDLDFSIWSASDEDGNETINFGNEKDDTGTQDESITEGQDEQQNQTGDQDNENNDEEHAAVNNEPVVTGHSGFTAFERHVLQQLKEINQKIEVVLSNQVKLNLHLLPGERVITRPHGMPTIPVKTKEELDKLERYLDVSENLSNMSVFLTSYVSKEPDDEYKSVLRLLPHVLSNNVAKLYSLCGKKQKKALKDLKIWTAIKGAVVYKVDGSDLKETEKATQAWLRDAPYRSQSDGPSKRQEQQGKSSKRSSK